MQTILYKAADRGAANFGWLQAKHSFSFGQWYNPALTNFGALRVLNDDILQGGGGFPTHAHDNMEIITIPLQGALQHKDSTGGNGIINKNDVQIMSAGTGVQHSEFNASATEAVNLLQIWIFPKDKNILPQYDQKTYDPTERINKWQSIVSGIPSETTLTIQQNAVLALLTLQTSHTITYSTQYPNSGIYLFVIDGEITINNTTLTKRDAIGITLTNNISIQATATAEILLIEIPML